MNVPTNLIVVSLVCLSHILVMDEAKKSYMFYSNMCNWKYPLLCKILIYMIFNLIWYAIVYTILDLLGYIKIN